MELVLVQEQEEEDTKAKEEGEVFKQELGFKLGGLETHLQGFLPPPAGRKSKPPKNNSTLDK